MKKILQVGFLLLATLSIGCAGDSAGDVAKGIKAGNSTQIQRLRNCYMMYLELHDFEGPKNKEELVNFLSTDATAKMRLEFMGIATDELDAMFKSDRDGEEFEIRWGLSGIGDHAIVFEKTGVDGNRLVALGTPKEVGGDEYDDYFSGKIKAATPDGGAPGEEDIPDKDLPNN